LWRKVSAKHPVGQILGHRHPIARDEVFALGQSPMGFDKVLAWDAVAIEEDAVVALAGANGVISDRSKPEATVRLPYMDGSVTDTEVPHNIARPFVRTIVRDDDLEVIVGLV
jgi:hypothetical protein